MSNDTDGTMGTEPPLLPCAVCGVMSGPSTPRREYVEHLRAEIGRLRTVIRVNALRWNPTVTHEEIDRVINGE